MKNIDKTTDKTPLLDKVLENFEIPGLTQVILTESEEVSPIRARLGVLAHRGMLTRKAIESALAEISDVGGQKNQYKQIIDYLVINYYRAISQVIEF